MYLLDSDTLSNALLTRRNYPALRERIRRDEGSIAISIVSVAEFLRHLLREADRARTEAARTEAYKALADFLAFLQHIPTLRYDAAAAEQIARLDASDCRKKPRDCRIAAIALANECTVVTANARDFNLFGVPNEDWTNG